MVASNQPFDEVEKPEFIAMMEYAQNHTPPASFKMPQRDTIRRRVMDMGDETIESIKDMFAVSSSTVFLFQLLIVEYRTSKIAWQSRLMRGLQAMDMPSLQLSPTT